MNKIKKVLCLVVMALLIFVASGYAQDSSEMLKRYYSTSKIFSISYPIDYSVQNDVYGTEVMGLSPVENVNDKFRENVNVISEQIPDTMGLDEYYKLSIGYMKKLMTDFKIYDTGKDRIYNVDAKYIICYHRMGEIKLKVLLYILVKNNHGYAISCTASPESFNIYKEQFKKIAATFQTE